VEVNLAGELLRDYAQLDVFARDEWQFDGPDGEDVEGWTTGGGVSDLAINLTDHALAMKASGTDPKVVAPGWTSIDADALDTIVLRARQHAGAREAQIFWAREGEGFDEARSVKFTHPGGGEWAVLELDMGAHPEWSGTITQLRLDPWNGGPFEAAEAW